VLAIDARRRTGAPGWEVTTHGGRQSTTLDALAWAREGVQRGAGEILLTSMDADGTKAGYDLELTRTISSAVEVPVIASGGAGKPRHFAEVLGEKGGADAALAASLFHFGELTVPQVKDYLREQGIPVVYRRQDPPEDRGGREPTAPPGSRAFAWQRLRTMRRAEWTGTPAFHYGLGVEGYAQVTSPLRRFQDFLTHRQIRGWLEEGRPPLAAEDLIRWFGDLEAQGEALVQVEREGKRYWLLRSLEPLVEQVVEGEVVAQQGSRALVELVETMLMAPVSGLGHLALGTLVQVRIREVDPRGDRLVLAPV